MDEELNSDEEEEALRDKETPALKKRLIWSIGLLLVLMYFSMGHMMLDLPVPGFLHGNHVGMGVLQTILTVIIMFINRKFFISGLPISSGINWGIIVNTSNSIIDKTNTANNMIWLFFLPSAKCLFRSVQKRLQLNLLLFCSIISPSLLNPLRIHKICDKLSSSGNLRRLSHMQHSSELSATSTPMTRESQETSAKELPKRL